MPMQHVVFRLAGTAICLLALNETSALRPRQALASEPSLEVLMGSQAVQEQEVLTDACLSDIERLDMLRLLRSSDAQLHAVEEHAHGGSPDAQLAAARRAVFGANAPAP
jgi:hypothetical protein